jgi:hypothetical protein
LVMNLALRIWTGSLVSLGSAVKERDFRTGIGFSVDWTNPADFNIACVLVTGPRTKSSLSRWTGAQERIATAAAKDIDIIRYFEQAKICYTPLWT